MAEDDGTKSTPRTRPLEEEEKEKLRAEARKADAEARKAAAEAEKAEAEAEATFHAAKVAQLLREDAERKAHRAILADDFDHHVYHFGESVSSPSVEKCMKQLRQWDRENPDCDIEISFSSPGGSVIDGMELFDFITSLRTKGHRIVTSTYGMAASMAGILLQAGEVRRCGPQAYILIHEVSFSAGGKFGVVEDEVKFVKKIQGRVLDIFADRCANADPNTATKKLTRSKIARGWNRTDWWISSDEALAFGLVDEIA